MNKSSKPDLTDAATVDGLPLRRAPYWQILEYCRHLGLEKRQGEISFWLARTRNTNGGYIQKRLAVAQKRKTWITSPQEATALAATWFQSPSILQRAANPRPIGTNRVLHYTKSTAGFTVGDAMRDYVEWKRIAAAASHFETNLSLINYHIIPRLGDLLVESINPRVVTKFCTDILETPPKRGNQPVGPRRPLNSIDPESLRKRKKTVNALIGILRLAFRLAWENGEIASERTWRSLRRLPNVDAPRHIFLNRDECRALIENCRPDLATLVLAALYTGCRVSELARMRVGDVGAGVFGVYVRPSKNGRARYVVLPSEGMSYFLTQSRDRPPEEFLFRMETGKTWAGNHKHLFKAAVRAAGIDQTFVFHGLRHTYASQLVQAGTPLAVVASQLGHANTDTVSRTYGHLCCLSIEAHLERGFAVLDDAAHSDAASLDALRKRLSLGSAQPPAPTAWPRANFALAQFVGPRC